jgi:di/tricarboxylate transporter
VDPGGKVFLANFAAHVVVGVAAWLWLRPRLGAGETSAAEAVVPRARMTGAQGLTVACLSLWVLLTLWLSLPVGFSAFVASSVLILARAADESAALRKVPWAVIVMVTGMTTLVSVLEKTGGMALVTALLAALASPATVNGTVAFVTGLISTWSSTSGVVMPAFLPTSTALAAQVGGGDPFAIALSINVGSSLVDVSPLSTIGALCVAAVTDPDAARSLFRSLMIWGLSMTLVGALLCQLGAGFLARL